MRVFVAGGSGVLGSAVVEKLVADGHEVGAMSRSRDRGHRMFRLGAEPIACNALDPEAVTRAVTAFGPEVLVNQLTSIPKRVNPRQVARQLEPTNRLRREGTANLVAAAARAGVRRIVSQSVAFLYAPGGESPSPEDAPLHTDAPAAFSAVVQAVVDSERSVLEVQVVEGVVLRYGFLYGTGTIYQRGGSFARDVERWRVPVIGDGGGCFSFVHVDDAAAATVAAISASEPGVYNVVDDEPAPVRDWLPAYAQMLGAPRPLRVPRLLGRLGAGPYGLYLMTQAPGASNGLALERLCWRPRHPSWRDGFRRMLRPG